MHLMTRLVRSDQQSLYQARIQFTRISLSACRKITLKVLSIALLTAGSRANQSWKSFQLFQLLPANAVQDISIYMYHKGIGFTFYPF